LIVHFSRFAGNTATAGSNLDNNSTTALVTNNWWGTVTPGNTIHTSSSAVTGTTTFDPYINLTHTASPSPIRINQSTTLTADISKDNHGTTVTNLTEVIGLPVTFDNAVLGSIPNAQPETIGAAGTATATFDAGGSGGLGKADATVDQAVVTASFTILGPPVLTKTFGAATIPLNGTTSLTFKIQNNNTGTTLNGVGFSDTLPAGLIVSTPNGFSGSCGGGTITATQGTGVISLSGGSIAASSSCTFSVNVTGVAAGQQNNITGNVTSTEGGTGATASANTVVVAPPSIAQAFNPLIIGLNAKTSLTFTITNPTANTVSLTGVAFTDTLPSGLIISSPSGFSGSCGSGTITATQATSAISLSGGSIAVGGSCTFSVNVTGTATGQYTNSTSTVSSTNGGAGNSANANLTVASPPTITKVFGAPSIPLSGTTSLTFNINNPNTSVSLTGISFTDNFPSGLVISTPNGFSGGCGSGTITATQGTGIVTLSGGSIAASNSCAFSVNVTGIAAGQQNNTTGNVTSNEGGSGGTASNSVKVEAPPVIAQAFNPITIAPNATTSLTFTITNPAANVDPLSGVAFTDALPTGLTVATASATFCGGTLTTTAPSSIAFSGATITTGSPCQFSVTVTGAAAGQYNNTTGSVTSNNGGTGNSAAASVSVAQPPAVSEMFGASTIPLNGTTSLAITIQNPNPGTTFSGLAINNSLPAGLVVATSPNLISNCGGTATAGAGSSSISLSSGTLAPNSSCTVSLNLEGTTTGVKSNTFTVSSDQSSPVSSGASITVVGPPLIMNAFGATTINLAATTTLSFTITNPNATIALSGVGFIDTLPAGLQITSPNGLTGSCGVNTVTTSGAAVTLSGASIPAGGSCTFSVNVLATAGGVQNNTTGTVTSTEGGSGSSASASITVLAPDLAIVKSHLGNFMQNQIGASYAITVSNRGGAPTVGTVTVSDIMPAGVTATNVSGIGWTCASNAFPCTRGDALASGSSYPAINATVNVADNAPAAVTNTATVSGGGDSNPDNNSSSDPTTITSLLISLVGDPSSITINAGQIATYTITATTNGTLSGLTSFTVSGVPATSKASFTQPQISVSSSPTTTTLNILTNVAAAKSTARRLPTLEMASFIIFGFPLMLYVAPGKRRKLRNQRWIWLSILVLLVSTMVACGSGNGLFPSAQHTPPGTYKLTITATSGHVTGQTTVELVVK
jgi:hypothetical protein